MEIGELAAEPLLYGLMSAVVAGSHHPMPPLFWPCFVGRENRFRSCFFRYCFCHRVGRNSYIFLRQILSWQFEQKLQDKHGCQPREKVCSYILGSKALLELWPQTYCTWYPPPPHLMLPMQAAQGFLGQLKQDPSQDPQPICLPAVPSQWLQTWTCFQDQPAKHFNTAVQTQPMAPSM